MKNRSLDITGKRFGKLVAVERLDKKFNIYQWKCKCDCGNEHITLVSTLQRGDCKSCGCIGRKRIGDLNRLPDGESAKKRIFFFYKKGAKLRGLFFDLSLEEVVELTQQNCHYCGILPSNSTKAINAHGGSQILWNGIDRVNNKEGYIKQNVVPCCKQCNFAKYKSSYEEFMQYIERLTKFYVAKTGINF